MHTMMYMAVMYAVAVNISSFHRLEGLGTGCLCIKMIGAVMRIEIQTLETRTPCSV